MIDFYYWPTPNGHKVTIFLEETGTPYRLHPIDIMRGDQFKPDYLRISPNNKMPAIVDQDPAGGCAPVSVFESGAILMYLAEKTNRFNPQTPAARAEMLQWLFWQMAALGPMAGQNHHFNRYAPERIPYAIDRYLTETARLYGVLDDSLADRPFIAGDDYGVTDMACHPWIALHKLQNQNLDDFPHLGRWYREVKSRPAVQAAYAIGKDYRSGGPMTLEERSVVFGQARESSRQRKAI